jgi:hypothetical protein
VPHGGHSTRGHWGAAGGVFLPSTVSGCILFLNASTGATINTTMASSGTSPPAVTLTGTLTGSHAIRIEITTGGARGTAIFRFSVNSGAFTSGVTTAATVALGATGVTANFPVGTYTDNNVYQSLCSSWADSSGFSNNVGASGGAANVSPIYAYDSAFSGNSLQFDGTADTLFRSTGGVTGSSDHTLFVKAKWATGSGLRGIATIGSAAAASSGGTSAVGGSGTSEWFGGASLSNPTGGTPTNGVVYTLGKTHTSGVTQGYVGSSASGSTSSNSHTLSAGFRVGSYATDAGWTSASVRAVLAYSRALTSGEIAQVVSYLVSA